MARRVFFSFHYERDIWRASQVRNSWITKPDRESAGFWDAASWEEVKKKGDDEIKKWIDKQILGTSVTVVLIGAETNNRKYVDYEIEQSVKVGNGLLAIFIHKLKNSQGQTDIRGNNPFDYWHRKINEIDTYYSSIYNTYDWIDNAGYQNLGDWVSEAAVNAGR